MIHLYSCPQSRCTRKFLGLREERPALGKTIARAGNFAVCAPNNILLRDITKVRCRDLHITRGLALRAGHSSQAYEYPGYVCHMLFCIINREFCIAWHEKVVDVFVAWLSFRLVRNHSSLHPSCPQCLIGHPVRLSLDSRWSLPRTPMRGGNDPARHAT